MTKKELQKLLKLGEGLTLEFKSSASHLGRELCALANSSGGVILLGVNDNGEVVGIANHNRTISEIQNIARNMDPSLAVSIQSVGDILVVTVPEGADRPYSANGKFYLREAATTQQMRRSEIREYFFEEGLVRWDEQPCREFSLEKHLSLKQYNKFINMAGITKELKRPDVLKNLKVMTKGKMTNAGGLLFAKRVDDFFLQAGVTCAVFQGKTKTNIIDQAIFSGSIMDNYQNALDYLVSHLNTEYVIKDGPRQEVLELPDPALREALINALAHRDYRSTANVQVHIFIDRVEIISPGGLVPGVTMKNIGRMSPKKSTSFFTSAQDGSCGAHRIRHPENAHNSECLWFERTCY